MPLREERDPYHFEAIFRDRAHTYFGSSQKDHVTPYAFPRRSLINAANKFLETDEKIDDATETLNIGELRQQKEEYRDRIFKIFYALLILNRDVLPSDEAQEPQVEVSASSSSVSNTPSKKRIKNLSGIGKDVEDFKDNYQKEVDKFADFIQENKRLRESAAVKESYLDQAEKYSRSTLRENKIELVKKLIDAALTTFNNTKGMVYENPENFTSGKLIEKQSYFYERPGFKDFPESGSGDSVYVRDALRCFSEVEKGNCLSFEQVSLSLSNSFFFPKIIKGHLVGADYDQINAKAAERQNSSGELKYQMARHLFLVTIFFPSIANIGNEDVLIEGANEVEESQASTDETKCPEELNGRFTRSSDAKLEFDNLIKNFVKRQLIRYDIVCMPNTNFASENKKLKLDYTGESLAEDYSNQVRTIFQDFHNQLDEYLIENHKIEQTPDLSGRKNALYPSFLITDNSTPTSATGGSWQHGESEQLVSKYNPIGSPIDTSNIILDFLGDSPSGDKRGIEDAIAAEEESNTSSTDIKNSSGSPLKKLRSESEKSPNGEVKSPQASTQNESFNGRSNNRV